MKLWPVVAFAIMSSSLAWACQGDPDDGAGGGGEAGAASGGAGSGGAGTGGAGTGGALGGGGGELSCDPEAGSEVLGGAGGAGSAEIFGDWTDKYGSSYSFDQEVIDSGYAVYDVVVVNDGEQFVVARNSESADFYPCQYSRFDWAVKAGDYYLCRTDLDADSVDEALARPAADRSDLDAGCSGFPWSQVSAQ